MDASANAKVYLKSPFTGQYYYTKYNFTALPSYIYTIIFLFHVCPNIILAWEAEPIY
jgi:hypothetical protein